MNSQPSSPSCGLTVTSQSNAGPAKPNIFSAKLEEIFGVDLRSLALFRIGLSAVVLVDLVVRWSDLRIFYTDFGLLPRYALIEKFLNEWFFSFHLISGAAWVQWVLFSIAAVCGLGMMVGYRTQLMIFLSWLLLTSLQSRNPLVLQGGDVYMRVLLFWGMFVPLGARYSIDAALDTSEEKKPNHFYSVGAAALLLQVALIYVYSAAYKWKGPEWHDGTAVYYALSLDYFRTPIGDFFLKYPQLLSSLTHYVLWLEILGPFLFFSPFFSGPLRMIGILAFISLHMGLRTCMELGPFPWISSVATLCLLPTWFWKKISRQLLKPENRNLRIYYDGDCGFCKKSVYIIRTFLLLSEAPLSTAQSDVTIHEAMKARNSWVVVDPQNNKHFAFDAFVTLCKASPVFWFFAPILELRWVQAIGNAAYQRIAGNRSFFGWMISRLRFRQVNLTPPGWMSAWAAFSLLSVFVWNHTDLYGTKFLGPEFLRNYCLIMRLDQSWSMFAPSPSKDDGWFIIPGNLKDGTQVDVFTGRAPVSWERPKRIEKMYRTERWRKYLSNLHARTNQSYRLYYGQYLCRTWNETHQGDKQLNDFDIVFMHEMTGLNYTNTPLQPMYLWKHYCFEIPKPAPTQPQLTKPAQTATFRNPLTN